MTEQFDFDLVIIGSGPASYRAAMQASKLKKSVCMIEKNPGQLGGSWIHTGTIPSKTLRESMEAIHAIKFHAGSKWVERVIKDLSTSKLLGRSSKVAGYEESLMRRYLDRYKIDLIEGLGTLEGRNAVRVIPNSGEPKVITASKILIATGSRPRRPENIPFDSWRVVDADEILQLEHFPTSMIIYGGGVIGCEYACIFAQLGIDTTIVDGRDRIMQYMDEEAADNLKKYMEEMGVHFRLGQKMLNVIPTGPKVHIEFENGEVEETDLLFFAAGRVPNTQGIGLERLGIATTSRGHIEVNGNFQTSIPTIYAAGDAIGSPALAATSASQGRHAALHMFGKFCRPFPKDFPLGVYTIPELSSVGLTEQELKQNKTDYVIGRAYYREVARGYIRGDEHGLLKILICPTTYKLLGIHIVGHDACNLIHIGLAFMQKNGIAQDLIDMVFNYPTLAEAYRIAAFNALNKIFPTGEIELPDEVEQAQGKVESA